MLITVSDALKQVPDALKQFKSTLRDPHHLAVQISQADANVGAVLTAVQMAGLTITDIKTEETDLEDIFLQLTSTTGEAA